MTFDISKHQQSLQYLQLKALARDDDDGDGLGASTALGTQTVP